MSFWRGYGFTLAIIFTSLSALVSLSVLYYKNPRWEASVRIRPPVSLDVPATLAAGRLIIRKVPFSPEFFNVHCSRTKWGSLSLGSDVQCLWRGNLLEIKVIGKEFNVAYKKLEAIEAYAKDSIGYVIDDYRNQFDYEYERYRNVALFIENNKFSIFRGNNPSSPAGPLELTEKLLLQSHLDSIIIKFDLLKQCLTEECYNSPTNVDSYLVRSIPTNSDVLMRIFLGNVLLVALYMAFFLKKQVTVG
jgi:hypothetical protein